MTKAQMIKVIKASGVVVNFSESYFNHLPKVDTERFFGYACDYMHRNCKNSVEHDAINQLINLLIEGKNPHGRLKDILIEMALREVA